MVNYLESAVDGITWHRFNRISIDNKYGMTPTITCFEQEAVQFGEHFIEKEVGLLSFVYNPTEEIAMFDPDTALPTGEYAVGLDMRKILYSYIMHEILKRDAPVITLSSTFAPDGISTDGDVSIAASLDSEDESEVFEADAVVV